MLPNEWFRYLYMGFMAIAVTVGLWMLHTHVDKKPPAVKQVQISCPVPAKIVKVEPAPAPNELV